MGHFPDRSTTQPDAYLSDKGDAGLSPRRVSSGLIAYISVVKGGPFLRNPILSLLLS